MEHEIPILNTAKFAAIVGIGPKFGYNSDQRLGFILGPSTSLLGAQENAVDELPCGMSRVAFLHAQVDEFSICLNKESGRHGYLTWGASASAEPVATARVFGKHHWATNLTDISVTKASKSFGSYSKYENISSTYTT